MSQQEREVLIRGLTLEKQMTKSGFEHKMDWRALKKMTTGKGLMDQLTQASKKRYNSVGDEPKNKLDAYFQRVD